MGELRALLPQPGISREGTQYTAEGSWYSSQWIRWRKGFPESMGGWLGTGAKVMGVCRKVHDWGTVTGTNYLAAGTTLKLYVDNDAGVYDITPVEGTFTLGSNPISFASGTGKAQITITSHGAVVGDYVSLTGAVMSTVATPTATEVNAEHRITGIVDDNTVEVVFPVASDTGASDGGSAIVAELQINVGLDEFLSGSGWGSGPWGSGPWGGATSLSPASQLRLWSIDNFGDDLIANVRTGGLYYWDESGGVSARAVKFHELVRRTVTLADNPIDTTISSSTIIIQDVGHNAGVGDLVTISGAAGVGGLTADEINGERAITSVLTDSTYTVVADNTAGFTATGGGSSVQVVYEAGTYYTPVKALQVMTAPTARHVIAFGANAAGESTIESLLVRWSSMEHPAEWRPTPENSAGDWPLSTGSKFVGALRTRQEIVIWTDAGLVSMRYVGRPYVFSFVDIEGGTSMISPNAAVNAGGKVYYMDRGGFYVYAGGVQRLPCSVRAYVFDNIDLSQAFKVVAGANEDFSEVIWLYPSTSGDGDNDSYVKYNYDENLWDYGSIARGTWNNTPTKTEPRASQIGTQSLGSDPLQITTGTSEFTATVAAHGLAIGDSFILGGSTAVGGVDADVINTQWTVKAVPTANTFTFDVPDTASSTETGGGTNVVIYKASNIYAQDAGFSADGLALNSYIESGDFDLEDGQSLQFTEYVIPDLAWRGTENAGQVTFTVTTKDYPMADDKDPSVHTVTATTEDLHLRQRGRHMRYRVESNGTNFGWRMGKFRFSVRPDGRRG